MIMEDVFCSREKLSNTIFYETEKFMLVYDLFPIVKGHMLIIPKRHVDDIIRLDAAEWKDLEKVKNKCIPVLLDRYCRDDRSYNIAVQIGEYSGREINHLHIHILPRAENDAYKKRTMELYRNIEARRAQAEGAVGTEVKELRKLFKYKPM